MSRFKRAGFWTKLIVLLIISYSLFSLFNLQQSIAEKKTELQLKMQNRDTLVQSNNELMEAIENSNDWEHKKDIARQKRGLLEPSEKIFYIVD